MTHPPEKNKAERKQRVLDTIAESEHQDETVTRIADATGMNRNLVYLLVKELREEGKLRRERTVGNADLYVLADANGGQHRA